MIPQARYPVFVRHDLRQERRVETMKYRIAFFTVDWNYELVESTLHGLKRFTEDHNNVSVHIFDCFGKDMDTPRNRSEYTIFRLADLSRYDGVLVQGNQIIFEPARKELAQKINETGIPAVSIGCPVGNCTVVKTDDRQAQYDITECLIRDHGCRKLAYITGILENGCDEAELRKAGFLQACDDHDIPAENITVMQGTWRTQDGMRYGKEWLRSGKPLPDAWVCANDEIALGLMETLIEAGYRIPEDIKVCGFDNITSAKLSSPRLSTISVDSEKLDYFAMQILMDKIRGKEKREEVIFQHEVILSESCGCREEIDPGLTRNQYYHQTQQLKRFYMMQDQMAEELFSAPDLQEVMNAVEHNRKIFGCDSFYLCMNDYYYDSYDRNEWTEDSKSFGSAMVMGACGVSVKSGNRRFRGDRFPTAELLPAKLIERERFLVFYPLLYTTYSIGYVAMNSISMAAKLNLHESIMNFVEIAIDNVRKKMLLRQLNDVLDELYVHDGLTHLFNRFGYERYAEEIYRRFLDEEGGAQILFIDMDDLKVINDKWGHEAGDDAIRKCAETLREACGERDFLMRYGGDEFLVIASIHEKDLKKGIEERLRKLRCGPDQSAALGMSIGCVVTRADEKRDLESCIQEADQIMYQCKKERKKMRR